MRMTVSLKDLRDSVINLGKTIRLSVGLELPDAAQSAFQGASAT